MLALLTSLAAAASEPSQAECAYEREAMLALDVVTFDQTEGAGWRPLYDAGCLMEAAQILRDWRERNSGNLSPDNRQDRVLLRILAWHEAQMWAFGERNELALPIFESSDVTSEGNSGTAWNHYVSGTIAFLRRDRAALEAAITGLAAIPRPPGWDNAVGADGLPIALPWPQNLDVLEGLLRCWDEPYAMAYLCRNTARPR